MATTNEAELNREENTRLNNHRGWKRSRYLLAAGTTEYTVQLTMLQMHGTMLSSKATFFVVSIQCLRVS